MKLRLPALCAIYLLLVFAGCATRGKEKWVSVIFDGVPEPAAGEDKGAQAFVVPDSVPEGSTAFPKGQSVFIESGDSTGTAASDATPAEPELWLHGPYGSRNCQGCHNSAFSNTLRADRRELCFQCHSDFIQGLAYTHGPAGAGECLACHTPHWSKRKFGLIRDGQELCLKCHQSADVLRNPAHSDIGDEPCQSCHNPHQSQRQFLLRMVETGGQVL